jgi:DNA-binding FrmR family transcriptional regulator
MKYDKSSISHRLKIIAGQIEGLAKMIEEDKYCIDILTQSLAVQKALQKVDHKILENHLNTCVLDQVKSGEEKKSVDELLNIYNLSRKA